MEAKPDALIVVIPVLLDDQVTDVVRSWVPPSDMVPMALYCWLVPLASEMVCGVTASETRAAGPTVSVTIALWPLRLAHIWVDPAALVVAKPLVLMVATPVAVDCHATWVVRFCMLPSE